MATRGKGIKSSAQDNFLFPNAPTIGTATNVGTNRPFNNGSATVTFTASGSGPAATSFTATSSPGGYTGTSATSPITVTGLQSATDYTFTVTASNANGASSASSASNSITATTVPATPSAPHAQPWSVGVDYVSWSAPASGGSPITNYFVQASDGRSGNTTNTYIHINQDQGTSQTYTVRADNANGSSVTSPSSNSVTTPFGVFFFFGAFYAFSPFSVFFFAPSPTFGAWNDSLAPDTEIRTPNGLKKVSEIEVGDKVYALNISQLNPLDWEINSNDWNFSNENIVETTVISVNTHPQETFIMINGDVFTTTHYILCKKDEKITFISAGQIDTSYQIYSYEDQEFVSIDSVHEVEITNSTATSINCEPYDNFFTKEMLVFDRPDNV
jgi:hypothetical protein